MVQYYFLETSEDTPTSDMFAKYLEELLKQGILNHLNGMIFGKPFNNLSFGHNEPQHAIPYELTAQIDPLTSQFSIDENSVIST